MNMSVDFLGMRGKVFLVMGIANKKSIAFQVARMLEELGGIPILAVRSETRRSQVEKLLPGREIHVCDVERSGEIDALRDAVRAKHAALHGILHAIAFADYEPVVRPFHETTKGQFLRGVDVSCYSLIAIANAFRELLDPRGSVVTISISTTRMASENYGFMAPIKAALDSSVAFLAKSFSRFSEVRFNAVAPSLLKTSASAGIPGYVDSYLFAEQAIPRKRALATEEAASVAVFLLSPRSSGINAQSVVVDAGMSINYFDAEIIRKVNQSGEAR